MGATKPYLASRYIIYGSFALGLLTAIAFRAIIVFQHLEPSWVRPLWYFAVLGNFVFFYHRYKISRKRRAAVDDFDLINRVKADRCFSPNEKDVLIYLLSSIKVSMEAKNYAVIFFMSLVAIAADLILSGMK